MSKLIYQKHKGQRIKNNGFFSVKAEGLGLFNHWFDEFDGRLKTQNECIENGYGYSSHCIEKVKSVKSFKRFIKKHKDELPVGGSFILVSRYRNYDVIYTKYK